MKFSIFTLISYLLSFSVLMVGSLDTVGAIGFSEAIPEFLKIPFLDFPSLFVVLGAVLIASADKLCDEGRLLKSAKKSHQDLSTDDGSLWYFSYISCTNHSLGPKEPPKWLAGVLASIWLNYRPHLWSDCDYYYRPILTMATFGEPFICIVEQLKWWLAQKFGWYLPEINGRVTPWVAIRSGR